MSARIKPHARLFQFAGENRDEMLDAFLAEGLREAAAQQWAFAREHWIPTDDDSPSAARRKDHKFGAAERLIGLIDPAAPALMPRHINIIPKGDGFLVRWQLGEETNSVWRASRPGADALAAELRAKGAGQAGKDTASRGESTQPANFFQPDHSYTHRHGYDFLCVAVTTHPVTRERLAIGWHSEHGVPIAVGINQWNHEYDGVQPPTGSDA